MSTTIEDRPVETAAPTEESTVGKDGITFETIAVIALVLALAAAICSVFAMGLAARSIDEHRAIPAAGAGGGPVAVSLSEFAISPAPLTVSAGGSLAVSNDGTTTHDLTVEDQDLATPTLDAGGSADLDVGALAPGTYTVFCSIPGHRESGMEAEVTVG
jgi:manganese oxidase